MATITYWDIIDGIIKAKGRQYDDEPAVVKVVEFENYEGRTVWGVTWASEPLPMQSRYEIQTRYVNHPRVIWQTGDPPQKRIGTKWLKREST